MGTKFNGIERKYMESMIITPDNLTLTRMAVIADRTKSELMAGAKAVMIENLKKQMRSGIAHFIFRKKDGSLPCSSIHGIFQARVLEWVAIAFSS